MWGSLDNDKKYPANFISEIPQLVGFDVDMERDHASGEHPEQTPPAFALYSKLSLTTAGDSRAGKEFSLRCVRWGCTNKLEQILGLKAFSGGGVIGLGNFKSGKLFSCF